MNETGETEWMLQELLLNILKFQSKTQVKDKVQTTLEEKVNCRLTETLIYLRK